MAERLQALMDHFSQGDYIGDPVSIQEHCLQAAALARAAKPDDDVYVAAALLHDIGHVLGAEAGLDPKAGMDGCGVPDHERLGGMFLASLGFPERLCTLVARHVDGKRYRVWADPGYADRLSEASRTTLRHQGGPMSTSEAADFERAPEYEDVLALRLIDEAAKQPNAVVPAFAAYMPTLERLAGGTPPPSVSERRYLLSSLQLEAWRRDGCLRVTNFLPHLGISAGELAGWASEVAGWPKAERKWLHHYELANGGAGARVLCRTENFLDYHAPLGDLCRGPLLDAVSQLLGEQAALFKEKINYKPPGGAGFAAHQDTPAYIGMGTEHVSVMLAIDPAPLASGCLQVAKGGWGAASGVPLTPDGCVLPEAEAAMSFTHMVCEPGDVLFFSGAPCRLACSPLADPSRPGYIPHRSDANTSPNPRRAAFITYNRAAEGQLRTAYYEAKHSKAAGFDASATLSFQGDFRGIIVE